MRIDVCVWGGRIKFLNHTHTHTHKSASPPAGSRHERSLPSLNGSAADAAKLSRRRNPHEASLARNEMKARAEHDGALVILAHDARREVPRFRRRRRPRQPRQPRRRRQRRRVVHARRAGFAGRRRRMPLRQLAIAATATTLKFSEDAESRTAARSPPSARASTRRRRRTWPPRSTSTLSRRGVLFYL